MDVQSQPAITIRGDKIALGPWQREVIPLIVQWENDLPLTLLSGSFLRPMTVERAEAFYERWAKDDQRDATHFLIYETGTLRLIGWTGLIEINATNRTATYHIKIGARDCWDKGYGTETTIRVLDYAFNALGLHNVMLETFSYNGRAIGAYTRAGFREMGRRRESARVGGRAYDDVYMDCLSTDFRNPLRPILDLP
jgi:diamine N-acetyltransferase